MPIRISNTGLKTKMEKPYIDKSDPQKGSLFCFCTFTHMKVQQHFTVAEATQKLQRYCAYQERCHKEVKSKLQEMGMIPLAIDTIITQLIQDNFLNETRFAENFVRGKFNQKKWGKVRLVRELRARDISEFNIKAALKQIDASDYTATLNALAKKRVAQLPPIHPQKKRKKLADYLLYRGWESHLVFEKVNELI